MSLWRAFNCWMRGHDYRVVRVMNRGARKLGCNRCGSHFAMHDPTRTVVPWDTEFEAMYAEGGPLDPAVFKG